MSNVPRHAVPRHATPGCPTPLSFAALHEEPYIMFSTEKKSMLCINCFRDMQG